MAGTRYVPVTKRERDAIRNLINGHATYDDRIHALNVIDAYDGLEDWRPVDGWVDGQVALLRRMVEDAA